MLVLYYVLIWETSVINGIFGIIRDVNPQDDPLIYRALTTSRELIFSNVLINDGIPYWLGMGKDVPDKGINHSGEWFKGKKDSEGKVIGCSHKNARYTIRLDALENIDPKANDPAGVPVQAIIYGGRDSDTIIPVVESLSWPVSVNFNGVVRKKK